MSDAVTHGLPGRLRALRKQRRLTLAQLSVSAEVSVAHLSRVEQGHRQPSLDVLLRLARTYGMSLGQLSGSGRLVSHEVVRGGETLPPLDARADKQVLRLLSGALPGLTCVRYDVGPDWSTDPVSHPGEEWIYVLTGTLTVELAGSPEQLGSGDAVHFDAWTEHRLLTAGRPASILFVSTGVTEHPA